MKQYQAEHFFQDREFPLAAALAEQRQFMVPHCHDFIEIVLIVRGSTIHEVAFGNGRTAAYGLIRGDLFAIMPGEIHSYQASRHLELYNVALLPEIIAPELPELMQLPGCRMLLGPKRDAAALLPQRIYLNPGQRSAAMEHLQRMIRNGRLRQPGVRLRVKTAFLEFLLTVGAGTTQLRMPADTAVQTLFLDSLDYMENDPARPMALKKLAQIAGMSISAYTREFRSVIGLSPLEYCIRLRLNTARRLLANPRLTLNEIAFQAGFCDSNYMIKLFREREGVTPGRLRRAAQQPASAAATPLPMTGE